MSLLLKGNFSSSVAACKAWSHLRLDELGTGSLVLRCPSRMVGHASPTSLKDRLPWYKGRHNLRLATFQFITTSTHYHFLIHCPLRPHSHSTSALIYPLRGICHPTQFLEQLRVLGLTLPLCRRDTYFFHHFVTLAERFGEDFSTQAKEDSKSGLNFILPVVLGKRAFSEEYRRIS